jgi:AAHS family benzoate transporter-like MFS transporter
MLSLNLPLQLNFIFCAIPGLIAIFAIAMVKRRSAHSNEMESQPIDAHS